MSGSSITLSSARERGLRSPNVGSSSGPAGRAGGADRLLSASPDVHEMRARCGDYGITLLRCLSGKRTQSPLYPRTQEVDHLVEPSLKPSIYAGYCDYGPVRLDLVQHSRQAASRWVDAGNYTFAPGGEGAGYALLTAYCVHCPSEKSCRKE
jgi:hypothetical protein